MSATRKTVRAATLLDTTANGSDIATPFRRLILNVVTSSKASSASLVVKIQGKDIAGNYYDLPGAATAAITTNTTTTLIVGPGITASANAAVNVPLPPVWRAVYTISGGTFVTGVYADLCA
jgi:hypothetical protein